MQSIHGFKAIIIALIAGICAIICVSIGVNGIVTYKKSGSGGITVTGSANQDFTSDLIRSDTHTRDESSVCVAQIVST